MKRRGSKRENLVVITTRKPRRRRLGALVTATILASLGNSCGTPQNHGDGRAALDALLHAAERSRSNTDNSTGVAYVKGGPRVAEEPAQYPEASVIVQGQDPKKQQPQTFVQGKITPMYSAPRSSLAVGQHPSTKQSYFDPFSNENGVHPSREVYHRLLEPHVAGLQPRAQLRLEKTYALHQSWWGATSNRVDLQSLRDPNWLPHDHSDAFSSYRPTVAMSALGKLAKRWAYGNADNIPGVKAIKAADDTVGKWMDYANPLSLLPGKTSADIRLDTDGARVQFRNKWTDLKPSGVGSVKWDAGVQLGTGSDNDHTGFLYLRAVF